MPYISELARMVHPRDGHPKVLAMIDGYLDESGIHRDSKICAIAGYFGGKGQWRKFEIDWRALLKGFDVPVDKFHSKDLLKRAGFFFGWNDAKHEKFLGLIADTIIRYKIHPIAHGIFVDDFYSFNQEQRRWLTGAILNNDKGVLLTSGNPDRPYFMPFQHCIKKLAGHAPIGGRAHFFFGLDRAFGDFATKLIAELKANPEMPHREKMGDPSFPLAKDAVQLQAADFLAYLVVQHMQRRADDPQNWNERAPALLERVLQRLLALEDLVCYEKEHMQGLLDMVNLPLKRSVTMIR